MDRVREEESQDKPGKDGKDAHEHEEPEPSRLACDTTHMQNSVCNEICARGSSEVANEEYHNALSCFSSCVCERLVNCGKEDVSESRLHHAVNAYSAPGMNPLSVNPRSNRVARNAPYPFWNAWNVLTTPTRGDAAH